MMTATRFGSNDASPAQRTISFAQCWISFVKTGEITFGAAAIVNSKNGLFDVLGALSTTRFVLSATGNSCVATGKDRLSVGSCDAEAGETGASLFKADVCSGALS